MKNLLAAILLLGTFSTWAQESRTKTSFIYKTQIDGADHIAVCSAYKLYSNSTLDEVACFIGNYSRDGRSFVITGALNNGSKYNKAILLDYELNELQMILRKEIGQGDLVVQTVKIIKNNISDFDGRKNVFFYQPENNVIMPITALRFEKK